MPEYKQFYSVTGAAKLYGISKSVISRAVNKTDGTGLSIAKREGTKILIAIDELMRVYGDPEQTKADKQEAEEQEATTIKSTSKSSTAQVVLLQAELKHAKELLEKEQAERQREREQAKRERSEALEQVEGWKSQAEAQTRLLTDERENANLPLWQKIFGTKK